MKSLYAIAVAAAFVAGYSAYNEYGRTKLGGALLANVEALAEDEALTQEGDITRFKCEGNTGACSTGKDEITGKTIVIHGRLRMID
ncbi:MAG: hypothetical protein K2J00_06905 [Bacteroidaceae bacterium]|nr:hypothetical protein [Bacteroidaceae bacterium]